jgi:hypothetical protein
MVRSILKGLATVVALPRAAGAAKRGIRRASTTLAVYAAAGTLLLAGCGFLLAALVIYLTAEYGALYATLMVGGGLIVLGLLVVAAVKFAHAKPRRFRAVAHAEAAFAMPPEMASDADLFEARLAEASRKHAVPLALGALAIGVVTGFLRGKSKD